MKPNYNQVSLKSFLFILIGFLLSGCTLLLYNPDHQKQQTSEEKRKDSSKEEKVNEKKE